MTMPMMFSSGLCKMPCVDPSKAVPDIIKCLNRHGVTIKYIPQVFELVKAEAERATVVYSPAQLREERSRYFAQAFDEQERERDLYLQRVAQEVCELLSGKGVKVAEADRVFYHAATLTAALSLPTEQDIKE